MHRRHFLASALVGAPTFLSAQPNGKFDVALIGTGGRGMNLLTEAMRSRECKVVGMCDVDFNRLRPATEKVTALTGDRPQGYRDFRDLLARERPEIVIVATPDHWHALPAIEAIKGGAHVFLETPIGHTVLEGRAMVKAARESDRVVQVGLRGRTPAVNASAHQFLRAGRAGKVGLVRAFVHRPAEIGAATPDSEAPAGVDWDMWCGPGRLRPYNKQVHGGGFRKCLDYSNGMIGDLGVDWMDQVLWVTGETGPRRVVSTGGRHVEKDGMDAPDTQTAVFEFEQMTLEWEHRTYLGDSGERASAGTYFYGTEGTLRLGWRDGWTFYPHGKSRPVIRRDARPAESEGRDLRGSFADFLTHVKSRTRPLADIEAGHRATTMSQLGMISLRTGRAISWDAANESIIGDSEASRLLGRQYRSPWESPAV